LNTIPRIGDTGIYKWFPTDTEENFKKHEASRINYTENDITYDLNSFGYRCPEFDLTKKGQTVFIGCSLTWGTGIKNTDMWSRKVFCKLKERDETQTEYINLSCPGASTDKITRILIQTLPIFKPKNLFVFFPPLVRYEVFNTTLNKWNNNYIQYWGTIDYLFGRTENKEKVGKILWEGLDKVVSEPKYNFYHFVCSLRTIQLICQLMNINLVYSIWGEEKGDMLDNVLHISDDKRMFWSLYHDPKADCARDNAHPGIIDNKRFANDFWNCYLRNYEKNT